MLSDLSGPCGGNYFAGLSEKWEYTMMASLLSRK
jgi:hypothetical protein